MTTLVIAAQHKESVWENNFVAVQKKDALATKMTAIDVISQEKIPLFSRSSTNFEQLYQVVKLQGDEWEMNDTKKKLLSREKKTNVV